jgi:hypothetical protein
MSARKSRGVPHLVVVPTAAPDADVIGFHEVPDRLPAVAQLIRRALALATGAGPFLAYLKIKGPSHAQV